MTAAMRYLDAHTHAHFAAYDADREEVLRRAREAGVRLVTVGTQRDTSRAAVALADAHEGVFAAVGLHPIHTARSHHDAQELGGGEAAKAFTSRGEVFDAEAYRALLTHPKAVAIGECGLDYFHFGGDEPRAVQVEKQKAAFAAQIALARETGKPLMIHCRDAFADLILMLREAGSGLTPGILHFFTGSADDARTLLDLGYSFTFGGVITFTHDYDALVAMIPADRILSETDAPYVAPVPYRGKRNEPAYVVETVKRLAALKGLSVEEMVAQINENATRVLGI